MTVAFVDAEFLEHKKLAPLEENPRLWADAIALWLSALLRGSRNTDDDGVIFSTRLVRIAHPMPATAARRAADALVRCGLWDPHDNGYQIHDFAKWRDARDRWRALADSTEAPADQPAQLSPGAARTRKWRQNRASQEASPTSPEASRGDGGVTLGASRDSDTVTSQAPAPPQTPPVPGSSLSSQDGSVFRELPRRRSERRARTSAVTADVTGDALGDACDATVEPWLRVAVRYRDRFESRKTEIWMQWSLHEESFRAAALWVQATAEREQSSFDRVADRLVDGLFADAWATSRDWPPRLLASQPASLYRPRTAGLEPPSSIHEFDPGNGAP